NRHYEKIGNFEPKCIEDELPFEIPDSWNWIRLGNLISIISGVSYDKKDVCQNGVRILRGGNINNLYVTPYQDDVFLPESYRDKEKQVRVNDIIIVASTGSKTIIGKAGYIDRVLNNTQIGAFLRIIRPLFTEIAPYIKLVFATRYYMDYISNQSGGTNINNIKTEHIAKLLIPIPSLLEQERVTVRVKNLFSKLDIIDENQANINTLYDELKKRTLDLAIQGKLVPQDDNDEPASELLKRIRAEKKAQLGKKYVDSYIYKGDDNCYYEKVGLEVKNITEEIPFDISENWEWMRLGTLFHHNTGKALNSSNTKGIKRQYITTSNLYWGYFKFDSLREMLFTNEEIEKCTVSKGDLLVCEGGDIGRAAVWNYDYSICLQNHIHKLRPCYSVNIDFYYYLFYMYKNSGLIGGKGIGIQGLSSNTLDKLIIPLPPIQEQNRIIEKINLLTSKLKDEV
ncbi:MAG: restriction endonuclease subunit S, partial [Bacilli bacterium]|nr:restriction endonuclease subunit S [Bacilli bacterium]